MTTTQKINPGLAPFDLTDYKGARGKNFYKIDSALQRVIDRYSTNYSRDHKQAMLEHISGYGELVGGKLDELTEACHKEGQYGELVKYDKVGNRIDEIVYAKEQVESRRISYEYGIVNLDFHSNWKHPFTGLHRYTLTYLVNMLGEGGVACPLAMTEGIICAIQALGTEDQKKKYLSLVAGEKSTSYFMAGQYVTERVGGSNVQANRTVARKAENGKWILNGEKWFCSNPGDLWVTTAKIEGTNIVGLFLVPRWKENGELNGHHLLRKKDVIGSKGKVTAEAIYEDLEAEELGRPAHGIANLIKYIIKISRLHVALGSTAGARRAIVEAIEYANWRTAYGKKIKQFPAFSIQLCEMMILQTAVTFAIFKFIHQIENKSESQEVIAPLLKYKASAQATEITWSAIMCLGGNGILGDFSVLPRLHNDSIINETWEGTHLIITDHFLHAIHRPKKYKAFMEELEKNVNSAEKYPALKYALGVFHLKVDKLKNILEKETKEWKDMNRVFIADLAYYCFALSELIEQAVHDSNSDSIYVYFASGFAEMVENGIKGQRKSDGIFANSEIRNKIIDY
ncbi:MAG: acyl-CoA dehydrogenase family protein [Leptospiraceae bacterium]|nr:acyl-CoA dehydrogenase family protein [Leptospiraceae bacterium]MCP5496695.1 acyl-CoA dehydrogenase family protein [Leptospiraceae bacterium]